VSQDEAFESLFQQGDVGIHEKPDAQTRQFEVGQDLRVVDRRERVNGLDLDDDRTVDDEVEPVSRVELLALADGRATWC